jgi:glycerophosphoryl diester phosphodiesterase
MADVFAHRGASAYAPEHTLDAYDLALAQGADGLELDVRATADGTLVVVHDATLARMHGDPRPVDAVALDDVPSLLTLDAVVARYRDRTRLLVELKDPRPEWAPVVVGALAGCDAIVQSFDHFALRRLAGAVPVAPLLHLAQRRLPRWASGIGVRHAAIDAALVARASAAGLRVRAWTVNEPRELESLLALGVDVITDVPDVAVAARAVAVAA